jgi:PhzF family phenazine biosynthesis protein
MNILKIAAFCDGDVGGNPAGVALCDSFPADSDMQRTAAEVGYSETAFAVRSGDDWRVRYFSPESEVPFCGHATIALGSALAMRHGDDVFSLILNNAKITVQGKREGNLFAAALQSPPTRSTLASSSLVNEVLEMFGYQKSDLDMRIPPALAHGGADHLLIAVTSRATLSSMNYALDAGRQLMLREGLVTILLAFAESNQFFHTRNAFASGGIFEDPATGAATAALAGYLRDIEWPHKGKILIVQGEDMGMRSVLHADFSSAPRSSIRVSGTARLISS